MKFIINRKTFISMLFAGLTMLGIVSYTKLPVELFPSAELPFLVVSVQGTQSVDPAYMEQQVVLTIEGAIEQVGDVEEIETTIQNRQAIVIVSYSQNTNLKYAYLKLQEKINALTDIPDDYVVSVIKVDTDNMTGSFMSIQVRGGGTVDRIRNLVDQKVVNELENIDGIAAANVSGGQSKSVEVILNEDACDSHGLTPASIRSKIRSNYVSRTFVGEGHHQNKRYFINVAAEYRSIADIENIVLKEAGPVLLKDVAQVYFGVEEEDSYSRVNGQETVTISLVRDSQTNLLALSERTTAVVEKLNSKLKSEDVEVVVQSDEAESIRDNMDMIMDLALTGGLIAIFVLWIFLRNIRLVASIALAIPISIYTAFNLFYAFDVSLNSLTLVGMALAVGMLLDNSVVVLENIYRHVANKRHIDDAVVDGTREVWRSILAATLTTVTVFVPFVFSENFFVRIMGNNIGVSIISTLLVSLLVAFLLIPMMSHVILRKAVSQDSFLFRKVSIHNRTVQVYMQVLKYGLRKPAQTVLGMLVVFFVVLFAGLALNLNVLEEVETKEFKLYVTMNSGSTLEATNELVRTLEERLMDIPEKEDILSTVQEEEAVLTITLKEDYKDDSQRSLAQIKAEIQGKVDDIDYADITMDATEANTQSGRSGGPGGGGGGAGGAGGAAAFQKMMGIGSQSEMVQIKGEDFNTMMKTAEDLDYFLEELSNITSSYYNVRENTPEVHLNFDTYLMAMQNISLANVLSELSTFQDQFSTGAVFRNGLEEYDITVKSEKEKADKKNEPKNMADLQDLEVSNAAGATMELKHMSNIYYSSGLSQINRVNQEKVIELRYRFASEINDDKELLEAARAEVDQLVAGMVLPSGVAVEVIHDDSELDDYYFLIGAAFILIFMILASVFESFVAPFVMMFTIPLALVGSILGLVLTGNPLFNSNTLTGFLILLGIVVNNGIILIDYANLLQKEGYRRSRALMMSGIARLRPILITAITTIVAMMPLAMGKEEYVAAVGAPFAITVVGGLTMSTLLTLVFVPTLYWGLQAALAWIRALELPLRSALLGCLVLLEALVLWQVSDLVWQIFDFILVLMAVPALFYFVRTSLQTAKVKLVKPGDELHIDISNLVKVYGRKGQFARQWQAMGRFTERKELPQTGLTLKYFDDLLWQIPLLAFVVYFGYFYVESQIWQFIVVHFVFVMGRRFFGPVGQLRNTDYLKPWHHKLFNWTDRLFFWGFPLANLIYLYLQWENISLVIAIGVVWYFLLTVHHNRHQVEALKKAQGRFAKTKRSFGQLMYHIPVIGAQTDEFKALKGVSLHIEKGMFGLLGPNGAGKSTLMRTICGIYEQSYGKIYINGNDTARHREELQGLIGYLPQEFGMYENMSSWDYLQYQAILKDIYGTEERDKRVSDVLKAVHMYDNRNDKIGSFSGGMKQRIGIAQTLLHLPRILVVDEPTSGLDPRERIRFRNLLVELSRERIVIFSTHIIEDIASSCNQVAVIIRGELKYHGLPSEMTGIAEGHVWQFAVSQPEFDALDPKLVILHHSRDGEQIKVRCLSRHKPNQVAETVQPRLEDSYLWLLKSSKNEV